MKTPVEFVEEWMKTICSNNVEAIVSLYKEEAVLPVFTHPDRDYAQS